MAKTASKQDTPKTDVSADANRDAPQNGDKPKRPRTDHAAALAGLGARTSSVELTPEQAALLEPASKDEIGAVVNRIRRAGKTSRAALKSALGELADLMGC